MAEGGIRGTAEDGDGAATVLGEGLAPVEIGARRQRAGAADAGTLQARAEEGGAPRRLVAPHLRVADVGKVRDDARGVVRARRLGHAEIAPGQLEPAGLGH